MTKTISKDTPLSEMTLRKYERPYNLNDRELVRKLCLSIGLLQPGDSRDVIVDVLMVLLKEELTSKDVTRRVIENREKYRQPMIGIADSNIRRQLKRLKDIFILESNANIYRIAENTTLTELFTDKIEKFIIPSIISRVKEYTKIIDNL